MVNRSLFIKQVFPFIILALFISSCVPRSKTEKFELPKDHATLRRGEILVKGIANCGFCHGGDSSLSKGSYYRASFGVLHARALRTLDNASGYEIVQAIREGKFQSKRLSGEPHAGYEWISDEDAISIATYLKSLPQLNDDAIVEDSNESPYWVSRWWTATRRYFSDTKQRGVGYVPTIEQRHKKEYGNYLVDHVARCATCHNGPAGFWGDEEYLAGGKKIEVEGILTEVPKLLGADAISSWEQGEIIRYLKTGKANRPEVHTCPLSGPRWFGNAGGEDLAAIAIYLRSLKE